MRTFRNYRASSSANAPKAGCSAARSRLRAGIHDKPSILAANPIYCKQPEPECSQLRNS